MDHPRPRDMNPPSQQDAKNPGNDEQGHKDGARKVLPYSVKELAQAKAAGR